MLYILVSTNMNKPKSKEFYDLRELCEYISAKYQLNFTFFREFVSSMELCNNSISTIEFISGKDIEEELYTPEYVDFNNLIVAEFGNRDTINLEVEVFIWW